jgi:WD40 repeat protein/transcriptional regulator with XRE-family HTH domain
MKDYTYRERDYAFGQTILTLRTAIGLTQAGLAERIGVSRRAVAGWEGGLSYPKAERLKQLIALGVQQQAFPAGREAEEIRALWKAAHQKVLLDGPWLAGLLGRPRPALTLLPRRPFAETQRGKEIASAQPPAGRRVDWGEALAVAHFYGREREVAQLTEWVTRERCRVVSVLGLGGIGKSALVVSLMHQVAPHFQVVLWRSLRDAPTCEELLADCLRVLAPEPLADLPVGLEARLRRFLNHLRDERALLVLDNLEVLLAEGEGTGRMRAGYEGYARLLRDVAQTEHQSCLLLTSREKPSELEDLEGSRAPVRSLRLAGLDASASEQLLAEKDVAGTTPERTRLIAVYAGNPLAIKIVAQTIVELFGGEIAPFLEQGEVVFSSVRTLLDEQFARISADEQTVLLWLAILREPVSIEEVLAALATPLSRAQVLDAVEALRRRSLIERGQHRGSFTLQSVVLEYAAARLIDEAASEIDEGRLSRLIEHGLELAISKEYVRQTQERLLGLPLLEQLRRRYQAREELEQRLLALLSRLRERAEYAQGYGPANVLALLRLLRGHLRGLDLSRLVLRGVALQGVEMQDANLSGALLQESVFTQTFDAIFAVAISRSGKYWAAGSKQGEVRIWRKLGDILLRVWQADPDIVISLAFSPDERTLATGTLNGSLKLWDAERGTLLWSSWQKKGATCLAFAPDGRLLASGGRDATVRLWDAQLGTLVEEVPHPNPVFSLAWSPDGGRLASGDYAGTIRIWRRQPSGPAGGVQTLEGHRKWVRRLDFSPDGSRLASASWDGTVKLWDSESGRCLQTLEEHTGRVQSLAFSPDGDTLASGSWDTTIRLWDGREGTLRAALQGHSGIVYGLAFTSDSRRLLSGSDDGTLRLWDVESTLCTRVLKGYADSLYDLAWSPDGTRLASAGSQSIVSIWEVASAKRGRVLAGHRLPVYGLAWSPDDSLLASSGWDSDIRLWDPTSGTCVQILRDREHPDALLSSLAWSSDGQHLACGTNLRGVQVWNVAAGSQRWASHQLPTWIRRVAWSPDGTRLAGGGDDGYLYVWDASDGELLQRLAGHHGVITSVAWSPDGSLLASGGSNQGQADTGELLGWDAHSGQNLHAFGAHPGMVSALSWAPGGEFLVSAGSDGRLRWWQMHSGECVRVQPAHQGMVWALKVSPDGRRFASCGEDGAIRLWDLESGKQVRTLRHDRPYERLNITGIQGLTQAEIATLRALGAIEDAASQSSS